MNEQPRATVLAVDDNDDALFALRATLENANFRVLSADNGRSALESALAHKPDVILLDVNMPGMDGLEVTRLIKLDPELRYAVVMLVSANDTLDDVLRGLDGGADDYIIKPYQPDELIARVCASLRTRRIYCELKSAVDANLELRGERDEAPLFTNIIGQSSAMHGVFSMIEKVRDSDVPILVTGESGTGKELVASAIHYTSQRKHQPFVVQNCSAFHENLLESELFGHVRGAFTGAVRDKQGLFEVADGGTFFLDELGEMSPALQVKLLRVLQDGTFLPVGGTKVRKVSVRVVAATHRNLKEMVAQGKFREDLYYRLNVVNIRLPALRERSSDIPLLCEHFLRSIAARQRALQKELAQGALGALCAYQWPGNIRELENEIERLVLMAGSLVTIERSQVAEHIRGMSSAPSGTDGAERDLDLRGAVHALEQRYIKKALERCAGNKSEAAKLLGISRSSLIAKCKES